MGSLVCTNRYIFTQLGSEQAFQGSEITSLQLNRAKNIGFKSNDAADLHDDGRIRWENNIADAQQI